MAYRLIDELPDAKTKRAPFPPFGLFILTWIYLPVAAPFWIVNWARLGHPNRRLMTLIAAVGAFAVPFALLATKTNVETTRFVATLAKFAFASFQLWGQRPIYEAHINRGGPKSAVWPLWVAGIAAIMLQIALAAAQK